MMRGAGQAMRKAQPMRATTTAGEPRRGGRRAAFTIMELLVVMATHGRQDSALVQPSAGGTVNHAVIRAFQMATPDGTGRSA